MKPPLIPNVIVTNQENPTGFFADALGVSVHTMRRLVLRGLIQIRTDGRTNTLRVTDAGKTAIRNEHAERDDRAVLSPSRQCALDTALHKLANKGVIEFSTDLNKGEIGNE